tara:strand:- start:315 stop:848 length:534 start_codon:yes stop_codon:yes gene_type:complete
MRLKSGENRIKIELPSIKGSTFNTETLNGKPYMLSFYRFASCPFCNLRVNELVRRFDEFGNNFNIIAIFDSPIDNLIRHTKDHNAPFHILADQKNIYYKEYGIEHSTIGMFKGMILRMPTLLKGIFKGYIPTVFKGSILTMPADFLIDKNGIIQEAYYGKDEGDHLHFDTIKEFSLI